ncbi:MAG TPA: NUDIX domain-containing protein [Microvirga sp.]|jgi:8-oxo-dGTP pyrophosphatase MutT (NUDIX family)|nr:NUDIX domain-containing protein [Microvirga sp.]
MSGPSLQEAAAASGLPPRATARAVVLDPDDRLLLIAYEAVRDVDPARPGLRRFWFTPGGGIEPGETPEVAVVRELSEEIGVFDVAHGPLVAERRAPVTLFRRACFVHERYFLVRLPSPAIDTANLAATENDPVLDVRWWDLDALAASGEIVEPAGVVGLARRLAASDLLGAPLDLT